MSSLDFNVEEVQNYFTDDLFSSNSYFFLEDTNDLFNFDFEDKIVDNNKDILVDKTIGSKSIDDVINKYYNSCDNKLIKDIFIGYEETKNEEKDEPINEEQDFINVYHFFKDYICDQLTDDLSDLFSKLNNILKQKKYGKSNDKKEYKKIDTHFLAVSLKFYLEDKLSKVEKIIEKYDINNLTIKYKGYSNKLHILTRRLERFKK
ncbi:5345_t:CDS:1 [Funneliformis caledonium]|uniref:5345_t:CDS:1 n=1 Tax=Funneliformis caledonium TaxID=1117310 RepID=A0A9N9G1R2_9GLOM|nr:5345_t:CDS:1 [Funneliformis caledonium]